MSIATNITLPMLHQYTSALGLVNGRAENATAEEFRREAWRSVRRRSPWQRGNSPVAISRR